MEFKYSQKVIKERQAAELLSIKNTAAIIMLSIDQVVVPARLYNTLVSYSISLTQGHIEHRVLNTSLEENSYNLTFRSTG